MKSYNRRNSDIGSSIFLGCLAGIGMLAIYAVFSLLFAAIGSWLWGLIMVPVFGLPALTYWQMYGLMILLKMLIPTSTSVSSKD